MDPKYLIFHDIPDSLNEPNSVYIKSNLQRHKRTPYLHISMYIVFPHGLNYKSQIGVL